MQIPITLPNIPNNLIDQLQILISKLNDNRTNNMQKLSKIYQFCDLYSDFANTFAVCKKGCSHCCKIPVDVYEIEAVNISKKYNLSISKNTQFNTSEDCPFLKNDFCSIYQDRPFSCRTFWTLDNPDYCRELDIPHATYQPECSPLLSLFINEEAPFSLMNLSKSNHPQDIRYFFK
jgi:uncharacterized protein